MRHSTNEMIAIAHTYFPRGMRSDDPRYEHTPEVLRQRAVRAPVTGRYEEWRGMLQRLASRFPKETFPDLHVENDSLFLQAATAGTPWDRCFTGQIWLPVREEKERRHFLEFLVSFVVPYYVTYSVSIRSPPDPALMFGGEHKRSFELSPDEVPFADAIAEEVNATFPGYDALPSEVGLTVVPDVQAGNRVFGDAPILTCLFSDKW